MKWNKSNKQKRLQEAYVTDERQLKTIFPILPTMIGKNWYWLESVEVESTVYYSISTRRIKFFEVYEKV